MKLNNNKKPYYLMDNSTQAYLKDLHKVGMYRYIHDENTTINTVLPPGVLNAFSSNVIKYSIQRQSAENLMGSKKMMGDWTLNRYSIRIIEQAGYTAPYGDFTSPPAVGVNHLLFSSGHYRYEVGYFIGLLEESQINLLSGDNLYSNKLQACVTALQTTFNTIAFNGKIGGAVNTDHDVYGILTHPKLNPMQTENKKITAMSYDEVLDFFNKYVTMIAKQTGSHFYVNSPLTVGLPVDYHLKIHNIRNQYGRPVIEDLKSIYPNLTLVPCPELTAATSDSKDVIVFIGQSEVINGYYPTLELGFSRSMYFSNVVKDLTHYKGKLMEGTFGCVVYKPSLIARCKFN